MPPKAKRAAAAAAAPRQERVLEAGQPLVPSADEWAARMSAHLGTAHSGADLVTRDVVAACELGDDGCDAAAASLITLVCRGAGLQAPAAVDPTRMGDATAAGDVEELLARLPADLALYPLSERATAPGDKRFRRVFTAVFEGIAPALHRASLLLDGTVFALLVRWLALLSNTAPRNIRAAATTAALGLLHGLAGVRAATAERATAAKLSTRLEELVALFLLPRVKDVSPEIRLIALQYLRYYAAQLPDTFVQDRFLALLQPALYDKKPEVRATALEILVCVVTDRKDLISARVAQRIEDLAPRIVQMCDDADTRCADLAMRVAALLVRLQALAAVDDAAAATIVSDAQMDQLLLQVTDERAVIRRAAGVLLRVLLRYRGTTAQERATPETASDAVVGRLCQFASSLRYQMGEPLAEVYLVDALAASSTTGEEMAALVRLLRAATTPPIASQKGRGRKSAAPSQDEVAPQTVACALRLLAAQLVLGAGAESSSLARALGPSAKDDLRIPAPTDAELAALRASCDEIVGALVDRDGLLAALLERYAGAGEGDVEVRLGLAELCAVPAVATRLAARGAAQLAGLLLQRLLVPLTVSSAPLAALPTVVRMWEAVTPGSAAAASALRDAAAALVKQVLASGASDVWARLAALGGTVDTRDQLPLYETALRDATAAGAAALAASSDAAAALPPQAATAEALRQIASIVQCAYCALLHALAAADAAVDARGETLRPILVESVATAATLSVASTPSIVNLEALACVVGCALDLAALPQLRFEDSSDDATSLFDAVRNAMLYLVSVRGRAAAEAAQAGDRQLQLRRLGTTCEAALTRICAGAARFVAFDRMQDRACSLRLAASALLQYWPAVAAACRPAGDALKGLYHTLREQGATADLARIGGLHGAAVSAPAAVLVDHAIVEAALTDAQAAIAEGHDAAAAVAEEERLVALGTKLSSMHVSFSGTTAGGAATERFYNAVPAMVMYALSTAAATHGLALRCVGPLCARLRAADAKSIIDRLEATGELPTDAAGVEFVELLRRAAKLEGATAPRVRDATTAPRTAERKKRPLAAHLAAPTEDDERLNAVLREGATAGRRRGRSSAAATPAATLTPAAAPGEWRGRRAPTLTASQATAELLEDEHMVATQEWK